MRTAAMTRTLVGAGLAALLVAAGATGASAATAPTLSPSTSATPSATAPAPIATPTPTAAAPTPTPTPTPPVTAGAVTIKAKTAGTGTIFSGNYLVTRGGVRVPAEGLVVDLQRKTPTGWDRVQTDAADVNGNVVYGTVRSNYVQTWRLAARTATTDPAYAVSSEFKVAQNGKAASALAFARPGFRTGTHVAFNGYFTYRSWWVTSGPDTGEQGLVAPLNTRIQLQYLSGKTWKTKTSVLTEDRLDAGINAYITITTQTSKPRTWRLYYPGSSTRTAATSTTLVR